MSDRPIIIVGAGIGGLTCALALLRLGRSVRVLEQAPVLGEIGAGVTLSPNAMKGYAFLGIMAEVAAAGIQPMRQRMQHWQDGRTLITFERGPGVIAQYGAPYVYIHRADLHSVLARTVREAGGEIRTGAGATSVRLDGGGPVVVLADGSEQPAPLVIGADGLKSVTRGLFEQAPAHFTGHVAWRSVVPVDNPVLRSVADFAGVHIGPGRMVNRYPVRDGNLLNLVFFARQSGWSQDGWTIPAKRSDLEETFAGWSEEVQAMIAATREDQLFKWAINARTPLETWIAGDSVALLGDAAHAMTPFMGQGAACAIEDAVVLARALDAGSDQADGLRRYQAARLERASFIQRESNLNADRLQGDHTENYGLSNVRNEEALGLFDYDPGAVPV